MWQIWSAYVTHHQVKTQFLRGHDHNKIEKVCNKMIWACYAIYDYTRVIL